MPQREVAEQTGECEPSGFNRKANTASPEIRHMPAVIQQRLRARPLLVIQGAIQAATVVTVSDLADGLRGEGQRLCDSGRGSSPGELSESQGAQDDAYPLNAGSQELLQAGAVPRLDLDGDWASRHTP
jgi:hypothetical protein